jgi:lipopolysaccharide export system permease protein
MKILDKYIAKNFIIGYLISLMVLVGLRIVIDLFVNLDEFAEHTEIGTMEVISNIFAFYAARSALFFRDFAGMITVVAAVFTLGKMTRNNELTAVMASGVSLKRIIAPIVFLAILLTGFLVIDQEFIIPDLANRLVKSHDSIPGEDRYDIWFMSDNKGALICTSDFNEKTEILAAPMIIIREPIDAVRWKVLGKIQADSAIYNNELKRWDLTNGFYINIDRSTDEFAMERQPEPLAFYQTDLTPLDIPVRRQETYKSLLSSAQLANLARQKTRIKDLAELYSQKHFRITEPIINMVMLMVALPILVCRDPKAMKSAIMISFAATTACFIVTFACKMVATEVFFNKVRPELWAWVPVFIFLPIAFIEIDSMKT